MSDYEKVIEKADKLTDDFDALKAKFDKVLFYLEDDDKTNTKGFISRLTKVENQLNEMVTKSQIDKGKKSVYYVLGGAVIWLIANFDKVIKFFGSIEIKA